MKHAVRALGWITTILWIFVIFFSGTLVYSAMQIGIDLGEAEQVTANDGAMTMSIPFSISNRGLYDISELNITTRIGAVNETAITRSTSLVPLIPKTSTVNKTHDISVSIDDILDKNLTYMLFNDSSLSVDMSIGLTYAYAMSLRISSNQSMLWGAPLSNLTVGEPSVVSTNQVDVSLNFENHAFFSLNGTVSLEIVDNSNKPMGSGTNDMFAPPGGGYSDEISVIVTGDPGDAAKARLYFNTSVLSFGPVVMVFD